MLDPDCFEKIGLSFSARHLPKLDTTSNTDPFLFCYLKNKQGQLVTLGSTSVIMDNQNPDWPEMLRMDYKFEETQTVIVRAYDFDGGRVDDFSKHDLLGEVSFTVSNLMCSRGKT
jgi:Ca2+-dependent lipid-binding protein